VSQQEKAPTRVLPHDCDSKYQDEKHGRGLRVMNLRVNGREYRCTVCGRVKLV